MRKYCLILFILLCISCESIFQGNENEYSILDKQQEKIDLLNGIYKLLLKIHGYNYFTALSRSDDVNIYMNYSFSHKGGSCTGIGGSIDFNNCLGAIYINLYTAIITANGMLMQLSESTDATITGELYFIRGYSYFKLARLFGTPPLVTDIDVNYLIKKPTYREVYEFIESDIFKAIELLPETPVEARIPGETPIKGTAKALLAEIYLTMAGFPLNDNIKYAEAAQIAGEIIEQKDKYNYFLLDDLADLWKSENRHNSEIIFGLFCSAKGDETENSLGRSRIGIPFEDYFFISGINPEFKFFNTYPNNYRKYTSFVTGQYNEKLYDTINGFETGLRFEPFNPLVDPCNFVNGAVSLKWADLVSFDRRYSQHVYRSEITIYLLRYAQTLLTYAEAKARSGNLDGSCFDAVNKIRRRANNLEINTPSEFDLPVTLTAEQFIDSVVWERAWELCTEPEGRWFDIVRLNLKDKMADYRYPQDLPTYVPSEYLNEDWYFYKIPQEDRWLNPNFKDKK